MKKIIITTLIVVLVTACKREQPEVVVDTTPRLNKSDSLALVDIYHKINGKENMPWWDITNVMTWGGVTAKLDIDKNEYRVTQIMFNCYSAGTLSEKVGDLTYLEGLYLWGKGLSGQVPESICKLKYLKNIRIAATNMSGKLPEEIFSSENLEWIEIQSNYFSGTLPSSISKLSGRPVYYIQLSGNRFEGAIPKGLRPITGDKYGGSDPNRLSPIAIENNRFTEFPFEYITDLTLTPLNASYNYYSGKIPQYVLDSISVNKKCLSRFKAAFMNGFQPGYGFENMPDLSF